MDTENTMESSALPLTLDLGLKELRVALGDIAALLHVNTTRGTPASLSAEYISSCATTYLELTVRVKADGAGDSYPILCRNVIHYLHLMRLIKEGKND